MFLNIKGMERCSANH